MNIKVGVIIVTYNRLQLLKECITHVLEQDYLPSKIVVVDNASTDGTKEYLILLNKHFPNVIPIFQSINGGGATGFRQGLVELSKDVSLNWYLLIDDDAMLDHCYIKEIVNAIPKYPEVFAFSGTVYQNGRIDLDQRRILMSGNTYKTQRMDFDDYLKDAFPYDLTSFCGVFLSSKIVEIIGLPIAEYFIWYDDTEYSIRIRKVSQIININKAKLDHKTVGIDYSEDRFNWKMYYGYRNRLDVIKRHYSVSAVIVEIGRIISIAFQNLQLFKHRVSWDDGIYNIRLCFDAVNDFLKHNFGRHPRY